MYSFDERNTPLLSIPEDTHFSNDTESTKMDSLVRQSSMESDSSANQDPQVSGIVLARRLRRMKRKLFLEAVGADYIASMSSGKPSLRSLSSSSSMEDASST